MNLTDAQKTLKKIIIGSTIESFSVVSHILNITLCSINNDEIFRMSISTDALTIVDDCNGGMRVNSLDQYDMSHEFFSLSRKITFGFLYESIGYEISDLKFNEFNSFKIWINDKTITFAMPKRIASYLDSNFWSFIVESHDNNEFRLVGCDGNEGFINSKIINKICKSKNKSEL